MTDHGVQILADLADVIARRKSDSPEQSYTAKLLSQGLERCAKKLGEEGVETALAGVLGDKQHLTSESADLLYHLLVLLTAADVSLDDVMQELGRRQGVGGLVEKAARPRL